MLRLLWGCWRLLEDIYVAYAAALNDVFIHALDSPWLDQLNMQAKDDIAIDKKIIVKEWYIKKRSTKGRPR